jgi:hypothetical protein
VLVRRQDVGDAKEAQMKYALLIYSATAEEEFEALPDAERQAITAEYMAIRNEPDVIGGERLEPIEATTTVRVDGARTLTTDGPFADTKEHLGGFYLVEAENIDRALELAARIPAARMGGAIEVRPIVER